MPGSKRTSTRQAAAAAAKAMAAAAAADALATEEVNETVIERVIAPKPRGRKKAAVKAEDVVVEVQVQQEVTTTYVQTSSTVLPPADGSFDTTPVVLPSKKRTRKTPAVKKSKKEAVKKPAKAAKDTKPKAPRQKRVKKVPKVVEVHVNCPKSTKDRITRVVNERMFLVQRQRNGDELQETYDMLGSTGNIYTVTISQFRNHCNCPDYRMGHNPCKHLCFVFIKVLHIPADSELAFKRSFSPHELRSVFDSAPPSPADVMVADSVRAAFRGDVLPPADGDKVTTKPDGTPLQREPVEGDDCPVCYSDMEPGEALEYCETVGGCGRPLHTECFKMWSQTSRAKGQAVTCVWCRTECKDPGGVPAQVRAKVIQGASTTRAFYHTYTNLGQLAGMV